MSTEIFLLPDVGEGLIEADIVEWKVRVGDVVALNQPLCDVETAKAVVELPSPYAGVITALHGEVGATMKVNEPLVSFEVDGARDGVVAAATVVPEEEPVTSAKAFGEGREAVLIGYGVSAEEGGRARTRRRRGDAATTTPVAPAGVAATSTTTPAAHAVRSTPPVRLYAKQHGVDIAAVRGTGPEGLVTREDVQRALAAPAPAVPAAPSPPSSGTFAGRALASWSEGPLEERIPMKGVVKVMAEAMTESKHRQPDAGVWVRADVTNAMTLLAALKQRPSLAQLRLSPLVLVALAFCDAARHYPGINSRVDDATGEIVVRRQVNLGIAADTPRGLLVPNLKAADRLDLVGMAQALHQLVATARTGRVAPEDLADTTLTITNVGPFGVDGALPILPLNTAAILCVGQVQKTPWVVDEQIVVRDVVELTMTFDHRQIDGALASRVLAHVAAFLREPAASLLAS